MSTAALIRAGSPQPCQPWPRYLLTGAAWRAMVAALAATAELDLLGLWADQAAVHALFHDTGDGGVLLASTLVESGWYPALSPARPAAAWFERMIHDLWGHNAADGLDARPWLDHGAWGEAAPLSARPPVRLGAPDPPELLPAEGAGLHRLVLGPVVGGIGEPARFHFVMRGERVVRLEVRLGYTHKGTLGLMRGKSPRAAARFAARLSGDSTVGHALAFAHAAEAAASAEPPPRARVLRAVMAELERIANHLADLGAVGEAVGDARLPARCGQSREAVLRAAGVAFGHRLMMDCVVPGGVAVDLGRDGIAALGAVAESLADGLPGLTSASGELANLCDRLAGTGVVPPALAARLAAGGIVGRASGRESDVRGTPGYSPYDAVSFAVPVEAGGDAAARVRLRAAELGESARLLRALLAGLPDGPLAAPLPMTSGEGLGWAEGVRGAIWHWLRLDGGQIASAFARDPGWLHWPLLEAAMAGADLDDLAACLASFGCGCSGVDL